MRRLLAFSLLLCAIGLGPAARAAEVKHVVVMPFTLAKGLDAKSGALLDEVHLSELTTLVPEGIEMVGSSDVSALLGLEQQKQLTDCDDTNCLVEIGNALGATHLLVPSLGEFGEQFIVTTKFIDVSGAKVLHRKVYYVENTEQALLEGVRLSVRELASAQGWVTSTPPTATTGGAGDPVDVMLYSGIGLAGVGGLAALGLGIGAIFLDGSVGDKTAEWEAREGAALGVVLMSVGSAVGVAAAAGGGALIAMSGGEE